MMTGRRNQLQEKYEDALFALMMDDYFRETGQHALDENERLKESNEIEISQNIDKRIRNQIKRLSHVTSRKHRGKSIAVIAKRVGIVLCAAVILTMTAFAGFPDLKTNLMNLYLEVADGYMDFHFSESDISDTTETESTSDVTSEDDFVVTWLPDGFYESEKNYMEDFIVEYKYLSESLPEEEACIAVTKILGDGSTFSIDTEDSEVRNVMVNNTDAIFTRKKVFNNISLTWRIEGENALMRIVAWGISEEDLIKIAESIQA
ncbi:MAG: DUF4367 domain-containing protein [Eubacteriales bacterium]|nr:DUF4367 domain-containing protein [Eubacteriales bacterium]